MNPKRVSESTESSVRNPRKKRLFFRPLFYLAGGLMLLPTVALFQYFEEERRRW